MDQTNGNNKMNVFQKLIGIFFSPAETFKAVDEKPSWIVPLILMIVGVIVLQYFIMDIALADRVKILEARGMDAAQIEAAQNQSAGTAKIAAAIFGPIGVLVTWLITAGVLIFVGNTIMGGEAKFKNVFAVVAWTYPVSLLGGILKSFLIISKNTSIGVTTSLAALLPTPDIGATPSFLYRLLSKFDIFTIWQIVLWTTGLAVVYKFTTKKSGTLVGIVWGTWIVLSVVLGGLIKMGF